MSEQLPYTVVRAFPHFDVRHYAGLILVQVRVAGSPRERVLGRRSLSRYVSGSNQTGASFALTAPVLHEPVGASEEVVSFVLPVGIDPASVPEPSEPSVRIRTVPEHEAAVLRFGGALTSQRAQERSAALLGHVRDFRLVPLGAVYFARFDLSWKPGFLARHEALVRVTSA